MAERNTTDVPFLPSDPGLRASFVHINGVFRRLTRDLAALQARLDEAGL